VGLKQGTGVANGFISVVLVVVIVVFGVTAWVVVLDIENSAGGAPNSALDTESDGGKLVLRHTNGDSISPDDTDYVGIAGNENITVDWNDNVINNTARASNREAGVINPITAGTEIAVVSNVSSEGPLRFVWFAVDGTGHTLLDDITPPRASGVDSGGNRR
jgi:hypothetical protein